MLRRMEPLILQARHEGRIGGFKPRQRYDDSLDLKVRLPGGKWQIQKVRLSRYR
ncbi:hypothetical protein [Sphingomonas sp.]